MMKESFVSSVSGMAGVVSGRPVWFTVLVALLSFGHVAGNALPLETLVEDLRDLGRPGAGFGFLLTLPLSHAGMAAGRGSSWSESAGELVLCGRRSSCPVRVCDVRRSRLAVDSWG